MWFLGCLQPGSLVVSRLQATRLHWNIMNKIVILFLLVLSPLAFSASLNTPEHDPVSPIILWVTLIFLFALLGRYIAKRLHQPGVLGELLAGVVIGNIFYYFGSNLFVVLREGSIVFNILRAVLDGVPLTAAVHAIISNPHDANQMIAVLKSASGIEFIKVWYVLDIFSRYGVIFLLFMVGLESSFEELKHTGRAATQVAIIGVIAPIILGFVVAYFLVPHSSLQTALFVAATLSATSIGITARVLSEMKKLNTREAKTILGAAMLDDVLGLIILAIVSSIVMGGVFEMTQILQIVFSALLFFVSVLSIGPWVLRNAIKCFSLFELWEAKLFVSFLFVMLLSWLATLVNLSSIIGAFSAGLIIHDGFFESAESKQHRFDIKDLVAPFEAILAPLFFVLIGIQVKLECFWDWSVMVMAIGLTLAAVLGKLVSGIGANKKDDRLLIGIGMLPRGEVGLVFASIGRTLGVISDELFSAIILMVIVTTLLAPPLMKRRYTRST